MRFHLETSLWHPGAALVASASPCGASRTHLGLSVIAFMGNENPVPALARRAMR
jgi:hypothetical protein